MSFERIVSIEVKPGTADAFEAAFAAFSIRVRETEAGTLFHRLFRIAGSGTSYRIVESYKSADAFDAHVSNPETQAEMASVNSFLVGVPATEVLEEC